MEQKFTKDNFLFYQFKEVQTLHKALQKWPIIPFSNALQLLDHSFPDMRSSINLTRKHY